MFTILPGTVKAVMVTPSPDDTVVAILQKGYMLNGKVVRPAMVKVAKHA